MYSESKINNRKEVFKMREIKVNAYEMEGYAVTVEVEGNFEEYATNFLHIFNNVRENKELLKVKNYYSNNDVTVYCEPDFKDALIKYLKMFGEIKSCEKVLMYQMEEPDYDFDKYYDAIVVPTFD
jgi:hypothetical protein